MKPLTIQVVSVHYKHLCSRKSVFYTTCIVLLQMRAVLHSDCTYTKHDSLNSTLQIFYALEWKGNGYSPHMTQVLG